jgi:hypothetical protein
MIRVRSSNTADSSARHLEGAPHLFKNWGELNSQWLESMNLGTFSPAPRSTSTVKYDTLGLHKFSLQTDRKNGVIQRVEREAVDGANTKVSGLYELHSSHGASVRLSGRVDRGSSSNLKSLPHVKTFQARSPRTQYYWSRDVYEYLIRGTVPKQAREIYFSYHKPTGRWLRRM